MIKNIYSAKALKKHSKIIIPSIKKRRKGTWNTFAKCVLKKKNKFYLLKLLIFNSCGGWNQSILFINLILDLVWMHIKK